VIDAGTLAERCCDLGFLTAFPGTIIVGTVTNSALISIGLFSVGTGVGLGSSLALHELQDEQRRGESV
jgi:hypothetical protein